MFDSEIAKLRDPNTPLLEKRDILWANKERPSDQRSKLLMSFLDDEGLQQQPIPVGIPYRWIDDDGKCRKVIRIESINGVFWDQEHVLAVLEEGGWFDDVRMIPWDTIQNWARLKRVAEKALREQLVEMCLISERGTNYYAAVHPEGDGILLGSEVKKS